MYMCWLNLFNVDVLITFVRVYVNVNKFSFNQQFLGFKLSLKRKSKNNNDDDNGNEKNEKTTENGQATL